MQSVLSSHFEDKIINLDTFTFGQDNYDYMTLEDIKSVD